MISLDQVRNFFPAMIRDNAAHQKYLLKEYIQLAILDYLSSTRYIRNLVFIGGTNLRLIKGIDRFSEDLDFDCKDFTGDDFREMTDSVLQFLSRFGLNPESREKEGKNLTAFQRNIHFPGLLFDLNLSAHREERFLIKIECQDQKVNYLPKITTIKGCGFFFPFPAPPDPVLCSMKIAALLSRTKGRDFYDTMFLLGQTEPDYNFLNVRSGIQSPDHLKSSLKELVLKTDLLHKAKDFEHLLFEQRNSKRILGFGDFIEGL